MVHYSENSREERGLKFELTTNDATMHEMTLRSLVGLIRMAAQCPDMRDGDMGHIEHATDILNAILPDEWQLQYGIEASEERLKAYQLRLNAEDSNKKTARRRRA